MFASYVGGITDSRFARVELTDAEHNLAVPLHPSCLLSAPAITNFSSPPNPNTFLFILLPSLTHFSAFTSSSVVSRSPLHPSLPALSSVSCLAASISTPVPPPSSYLSPALSGAPETENHLEKMAWADMPMHSHTHAYTRTSDVRSGNPDK